MTKNNKTTKKAWRTITIAVIVILSTIGLGGCNMRQPIESNGNQDPTPTIHPADERRERIGAEVLAHMYEKYGVEFNIRGHDWNRHEDRLTLYPVWGTFEGERVDVRRRVVDGEVVFLDNYFGYIIREDVENEVLRMLEDIDLPMMAFYSPGTSSFDNIFDKTKTLADFVRIANEENSDISPRLSVTIIVSYDEDRENHEIIASQIFDALTEAGHKGLTHVSFLPSGGFNRLTRANRGEIAEEFHEQRSSTSRSIN